MSGEPATDLAPLTAWNVEILRATAFPTAFAKIDKPEWWLGIVGSPPENCSSEPKKSLQKEEGAYEGGHLACVLQPFRIDWLWSALITPDAAHELPNIGPLPDALTRFKNLISKWLQEPSVPALKRLAFGVTLQLPAPDHEAAYRKLGVYLRGIQIDPKGSSDFVYQINRPRVSKSGMADLKINRLSKWSALRGTLKVTVGPTIISGPPQYACRLELDINTAGEVEGSLPRELLPRLFAELLSMGEEIVAKGDIP